MDLVLMLEKVVTMRLDFYQMEEFRN